MSRISQIPNPWPSPDFTVTFRPSKLQLFLLIAGSLLFIVGDIWVGLKKNDVTMDLGTGFFALCLAVFCVQLHPRASYLMLKKNSFILCCLFRSTEVLWHEVQGFGVQTVSRNKMVVWNYVPELSTHIRGRRIATALAGCEAALPDTYGFKAEDLADVMNQMRERHLLESSPGS